MSSSIFFVVLANHYHILLTDVRGKLPKFMAYLNRLVAAAVNSLHGRWENLFDSSKYSAVVLPDAAAAHDKALYLLANPTAAGLVKRAKEWPGFWSSPNDVGGDVIEAKRPRRFFREKGKMPLVATLRLDRLPGFEELSTNQYRQRLWDDLHEREESEASKLRRAGRSFMGVPKVLAQKHTKKPRKPANRRKHSPRVASKDKWRRIEALVRRSEFLTQYQEARQAWLAGSKDVRFPAGTWTAACGRRGVSHRRRVRAWTRSRSCARNSRSVSSAERCTAPCR